MSRIERVQEEIRQQVSVIVQQELRDPRIGFVTITKVEASPDLRQARVYFTTMASGGSLQESIDGLEKASGFIRRLLGERIRIKFTPEIKFICDNPETRRNKVDEIIEIIHKEKENADAGREND